MDTNTIDPNIEHENEANLEQNERSSNEMQLQALKVLINGIKTAQKRGAYELPEAEILWNAIKVFMVDEQNNYSEQNSRGLNVDFRNEL